MCHHCGKELDRVGYYCVACLVMRRKYSKTLRKRYIKDKQCQRCGGELQGDFNTQCAACTTRRFTLPFGKFPNELEV